LTILQGAAFNLSCLEELDAPDRVDRDWLHGAYENVTREILVLEEAAAASQRSPAALGGNLETQCNSSGEAGICNLAQMISVLSSYTAL